MATTLPGLPDLTDPDTEADSLPIEPNDGVVPPLIPDDPEHERTINPAD